LPALLSTPAASAVDCFPAPSGLISWWPGDGSARDIVSTNNGVLVGTATANAVGYVGPAFGFDGTNSSVQIPDSPSLHPTNFTIEAWVLFTGLDSVVSGPGAGEQFIVFKQNVNMFGFEGFYLGKTRISGQDKFTFQVTSSAGVTAELESTNTLTTNVWYHVAAVRGTNFTQLYVNGQFQVQTNATSAQSYGTLPLYFGTSGQSYWNGLLKGTLDEVSLYNRALSASEIAAIYAANTSGKCKAVNITLQPQSQTNVLGSNGLLSVAATGFGTLTYQWYFSGAALPGATNTSLALTNVQTTNAGNYFAVVTNAFSSATSSVAVLTVISAPLITAQPFSVTNVAGSNASFSVTAVGTQPLSYQWQLNGLALSGATNSSLTLANLQPTDAGNYTVAITNTAGAATSAVAALTVWFLPVISTPPANQTVAASASGSFSILAAANPAPAYQWRFNGANISGANGSAYTRTSAQCVDTGSFDVVLTNAAGSITSTVATLTVIAPPVITNGPVGQTVAEGQNANFIILAGNQCGGALSYQWRFNGAPIAGAIATSYTRTDSQCADAGNFDVIVTTLAGSITSSVAGLTVIALPVITNSPVGQTVAQGQNANFSVLAGNQCGGALSYQWRFNGAPIAGAIATSYTRTNSQCADAGSFDVIVTTLAGSITSSVAGLTVIAPPVITNGPVGQTIAQGQDANFSVLAGNQCGGGLAYQWRFNGLSIPGATDPSYTRASSQCADAGNFDVLVTTLAGSITSSPAAVTVIAPPTITTGPRSQIVTQGQDTSFSIQATNLCGGGLSYQWRFNGSGIAGATATSYTRTNAQCADAGNFDVVVSTLAGSVTSSLAVVTVVSPPFINNGPLSQIAPQGQDVTFSVLAASQCGGGLAYQWRFNGASIAGATGTSYTRGSVQCADTGSYDVVITNLTGSMTTSVASLTVIAPPRITASPASQTVTQGQNVSFNVSANNLCGDGLTYQWRFNGANLAGATGTGYTLATPQCTDAGNYDVVVTDLAGSLTSSVATLTVVAPPSISTGPVSQTATQGRDVTFSVLATNQCGGLTYQWRFNGANIPAATNSSYTRSGAQCADGGGFDVVVSNLAGSVTSSVAVLSVVAPPGLVANPAGQTVAQGQNISFAVLATSQCGPLAYQWRFNTSPIAGATGSIYSRGNAQCADAGSYDVLVTNIAGAVASSVATLAVVAPLSFALNPASQPVAQGQSVTFTALATNQCGDAPAYQWRFNGSVIPGANASSYTRVNLQCTDAGSYDVVAANLAGSVTSSVASLTVVALPSFALNPASQTVTQGQSVTFTALATNQCPLGVPPAYQWRFFGSPIPGATASSYTRVNLQCTDGGSYDVVAANFAGSTTSTAANLNVGGTAPVVFIPDASLSNAIHCALHLGSCPPTILDMQGLTCLSASIRQITAPITNLTGLEAATNLVNLYLNGNAVQNLTPLKNLKRLASLELENNNLADVSTLTNLTQLGCLSIGGNPLADLSVLSKLVNLTNLSVRNNRYFNPAPLAPLTRLTSLTLWQNAIQDLSWLPGLTNLSLLDLRWNYLTASNCAPLLTATNLTRLCLSGNPLTNVPPLNTHLTFLNLESCSLRDLSPLTGLTNLSYLALSVNPVTNLSILSGLTRLTGVELHGDSITNLTFLTNLMALTYADLGYNSITDLSPLANLSNLTSLVIAGNPSATVTNLSSKTSLRNLWLFDAGLTNADFLATMTWLNHLNLDRNQISDISKFSALTQLTGLSLDSNPFNVYSSLARLTNLNTLRLEHTARPGLGDADLASFLPNLTRLQFLDLNNNQLSGLAWLPWVPGLQELYLNRNRVADTSPLTSQIGLLDLDLSQNFLDVSPAGLNNLRTAQCLRTGVLPCNCGWGTNAAQALQCGGLTATFSPTNQPPIISSPRPNWFIACNATSTIPIVVSETPTPLDPLVATAAVSFNPSLAAIVSNPLPGTNNDFSLLIAAGSNAANNTASINLTVTDDVGLTGSGSVQLVVVTGISLSNLCPTLDPALAAQLGAAAGKPASTLANVDLLMLTNLYVINADLDGDCVWQWLTNVTACYMSGTSISNLSFATNLSQLSSLSLNNERVSDYSPLAADSKLTTLNLYGNSLSDLTSLHGLTSVRNLNLANNLITNVSPLLGLTNLQTLDLTQNPVSNFSPLAGLSNLVGLRMEYVQLTNAAFVSSLTRLTSLDLQDNHLASMPSLTGLTNLVSLWLQQNWLTDIRFLTNLHALRFVDISYNPLDLSPGSSASAVIQTLLNNGVQVAYQPVRQLVLEIPNTNWFILANSSSTYYFGLSDNGPTNEPVAFYMRSGNTTLLPNASLIAAPISNTPPPAWLLTATLASGQSGSSLVSFSATNSAGQFSNAWLVVSTVTSPQIFDGQPPSADNLAWQSWGNAPWFGETTNTHNGLPAAQSGHITDSQDSWLETSVTGPGQLTFWWKVSSETNYDFLQFYLNGTLQTNPISGEVNWQKQTFNLGNGTQTLAWRYVKDVNNSAGSDAGWLSEVAFVDPSSWLQIGLGPTNGQLQLVLHCIVGHTNQLQVSTNLTTWSTVSTLIATNATIIISDSATNRVRFYRLRDLSASSLRFDTPILNNSLVLLVMRGPAGQQFQLQSSTNLSTWTTLDIVTNSTGVLPYTLPRATNSSRVFFRAHALFPPQRPPNSGPLPLLTAQGRTSSPYCRSYSPLLTRLRTVNPAFLASETESVLGELKLDHTFRTGFLQAGHLVSAGADSGRRKVNLPPQTLQSPSQSSYS
jgi:Leucine-rich repeat (LRR) protein